MTFLSALKRGSNMGEKQHKSTKTRDKIFDTFLSIYETKPVKDIRVSEIAKLAGINRSTFYEYFDDPFDLLDKLEDHMIEFVFSNTHIIPGSSPELEYTIEQITYDSSNTSGGKVELIASKSDSHLYTKTTEHLSNYLSKRYNLDLTDPIISCQVHFLSAGIISYIREWLALFPEFEKNATTMELERNLVQRVNESINNIVKTARTR